MENQTAFSLSRSKQILRTNSYPITFPGHCSAYLMRLLASPNLVPISSADLLYMYHLSCLTICTPSFIVGRIWGLSLLTWELKVKKLNARGT